jgi:hypothetical protein
VVVEAPDKDRGVRLHGQVPSSCDGWARGCV